MNSSWKTLSNTGLVVILQPWDDFMDRRSVFLTTNHISRMDWYLAKYLRHGLKLEHTLFFSHSEVPKEVISFLSSRGFGFEQIVHRGSPPEQSISTMNRVLQQCESLIIFSTASFSTTFSITHTSKFPESSCLFRNADGNIAVYYIAQLTPIKDLLLTHLPTTHLNQLVHQLNDSIDFEELVDISFMEVEHEISSQTAKDSLYNAVQNKLSPLPDSIEEHCYARVGLMGNPSDGFQGKTLSFLIENFYATVMIRACSEGIHLHETANFSHLDSLFAQSSSIGYSSGLRLLQATCKIFTKYCLRAGVLKHRLRGFDMSFTTNIPRMVGLSGSSAIIVAAFNGLLKFYQLSIQDLHILKEDYPEVILSIERDELGISAGLQDRVIQTYGGLVHMDFTRTETKHRNVYTSINPQLLPQFYLAYNTAAGGDSGKVHSTVKQRWIEHDPQLIQGMQTLGGYADAAKECVLSQSYDQLAILMDANFAMRRQLYGDDVVGRTNILIAELAHQYNMSAKFSGSGGALLCLRRGGKGWFDSEDEAKIAKEFQKHDYKLIRVRIPPYHVVN